MIVFIFSIILAGAYSTAVPAKMRLTCNKCKGSVAFKGEVVQAPESPDDVLSAVCITPESPREINMKCDVSNAAQDIHLNLKPDSLNDQMVSYADPDQSVFITIQKKELRATYGTVGTFYSKGLKAKIPFAKLCSCSIRNTD